MSWALVRFGERGVLCLVGAVVRDVKIHTWSSVHYFVRHCLASSVLIGPAPMKHPGGRGAIPAYTDTGGQSGTEKVLS